MKTTNIIYWTTTILIFLFEGVMPALTGHTELAVKAIRALGYPDYFRVMLNVFKVAGALVVLLPVFKGAIKEWAYAGFTFSLIAASVSNACVYGFANGEPFMPLVVLAVLAASYITYHKKINVQVGALA